MSAINDHRLTHFTPDDHQRWLWFVHICCPSFAIIVGCLRLRKKWKHLSSDDVLLLLAYLVYAGYWLLVLFAMLSELGKSENQSSRSERAEASKLLLWSRVLLVLVLCLVKASVICLIKTIFTSHYHTIVVWVWAIAIATVAEALLGSILISAVCSTTGLLEAPNNSACSNNVTRWVILTTLESIFEFVLIVPVASTVWRIQFPVVMKVKVTAAFLCRLIVWIPAWFHASLYMTFIRSATSSIDIVPTVITEELWIAISLISASLPLILSDMGKFSTLGMQLSSTSMANSSHGSRTREQKLLPIPLRVYDEYDEGEEDSDIILRPQHERGRFSTSIRGRGLSQSSCTTESKKGILREVNFESSSTRASRDFG